MAALGDVRVANWSRARLATTLVVVTGLKEIQEWALHGARLFDGIGTLEAIDKFWRWLTGG